MSLLQNVETAIEAGVTDVENVAEASLQAIETFIVDDVWPELKQFLQVFDPLEAKALLGDLISAIPLAAVTGPSSAAVQVATEIGPQTVANAITAAQSVKTVTETPAV